MNVVRNEELPNLVSCYQGMAAAIQHAVDSSEKAETYIALDGTHGVAFQHVTEQIVPFLQESGYVVDIFSTYNFTKSGEELRELFKDNITDNRAFGYFVDDYSIDSYFHSNAKSELTQAIEKSQAPKRIVIVSGPGACWIRNHSYDLTFFLDLSRENQQIKHKNEDLLNFGMSWNIDGVEKYKIALFVEWPILENYRKSLFSDIQYYVDMNDETAPVMVKVKDLIQMIDNISQRPFRVKPFFAPGVWGGQYLKEMADLPKDWINCAWSFEPIAPENSILIQHKNQVIEVPFLIIMALSHQDIMGERVVDLFGDYFPIRFNYLDTFAGDNLSTQVHPTREFIREQFNERLEQQESYYIMDCLDDAKVYLGLTENCEGNEFLSEVKESQITGEPVEFTKYVQEWDSKKGNLYLIPTGTVHASGVNNLVLEVSSTTWWFTFKIYDYVRKDLDGKPRPINIDFAEKNIDFSRKKSWVENNLIQQPQLLRKEGENEEYVIGSREDLLFYVNRIHLNDEISDDTNGEFFMINLVEGEKVRIVSTNDESIFVELEYAEAYTLPSVFGPFKIVNLGSSPCKLIKAGVSKDWNVRI